MNRPARWALSLMDWQVHAVDESADHLYRVWVARCGRRLLTVTVLHHNPTSQICPICARWTLR